MLELFLLEDDGEDFLLYFGDNFIDSSKVSESIGVFVLELDDELILLDFFLRLWFIFFDIECGLFCLILFEWLSMMLKVDFYTFFDIEFLHAKVFFFDNVVDFLL